MTIALDTTALLARYLDGPDRPVILAAMATDHEWCASALVLTEALSLVDRLGDDPDRTDELRRAVRDDWERIHVVPLDQRCLDRAAELGRTQPVRTIDALHLAAADRLPGPVAFATFDPAQIPVAGPRLRRGLVVTKRETDDMVDLAATLHHADTDLEIHKLVVGPMDNNVFVLRCRHTGDAVLIDAANEHEKLLELARALNVRRVLETHGHWDHIQAIPEMRDAGYTVGVTSQDAGMLESYDDLLEDDSIIEVGNLRVRTILNPGHTPGSMSFLVEGKPLLFSGDTLFPGGPGNTAYEGGDFATIIRSIEDQMFSKLPGETIVMPGHGDDTTIGTERPHLQEWIDRGW